jgi:hypothetical protein
MATDFRLRSSATRCGSITVSRSASGMSKTCWPSGASPSPTRPSASGTWFGPAYARTARRRRWQQGRGTRHLDELFVTLNGRQQYLCRAVDEDGDVLDILVQSRRNRRAAVRFFRKFLKRQGCVPRRRITDKLRSYPAAHRRVMPSVPTARTAMRTTGPRCRINRRGSASGTCAALNRRSICNASRPFTESSRISSKWADIYCGRRIIAYFEPGRSSNLTW